MHRHIEELVANISQDEITFGILMCNQHVLCKLEGGNSLSCCLEQCGIENDHIILGLYEIFLMDCWYKGMKSDE